MEIQTLMTGGSGLLGRHLKLKADRPISREFNIEFRGDWHTQANKPYDLVVHCAAYTDTVKAEKEKYECFETNVFAVVKMLEAFPDTPIVYISTEYAEHPQNFYSWTKKWAEEIISLHPKHLIIRTLFKAKPWKYEYAFSDAYTLGGYVGDVAPLIDKAIMDWDRKTSALIYVGDGRGKKSMLDLARETKPDVKANSIKDKKGVIISK